MVSSSLQSSDDSRRHRSRADDTRLSVTEASFHNLSITSQSPSPTHPPSDSNPSYTSNQYLGSTADNQLENILVEEPELLNQEDWPAYPSPNSSDRQVPGLRFGLEYSLSQAHSQYDENCQPQSYSSPDMTSLDYVTMLPSGPFVQPGFYSPSQFSSMPGYGELDPLSSETLGSTLPSAIQGSTLTTSASSYPTLSSTVDREIERQRRRHSPGREWPSRRSSHRERSASTSSYRSRKSSNATMAYSSVGGMASQQPLPAPNSESPGFHSPFLGVSSSPPPQPYYSTRPEHSTYEYPPLPSQPLYGLDRTLPPSSMAELGFQPGYATNPIGGSGGVDDGVRVVGSRPKPQCWDHGCNGRQFSTFSNLLRHQREKSGTAAKSECPYCGTVFTRTTARNGHMSQGKCKGQRRESASDE